MGNSFGVPEITVKEVDRRLANGENFVLMDVREPQELMIANLGEKVVHVPMSQIAAQRIDALPEEVLEKSAEIVVMCHHGSRSAQVAAWLSGQGWTNVWNLTGGIDAYAREVDPAIGFY